MEIDADSLPPTSRAEVSRQWKQRGGLGKGLLGLWSFTVLVSVICVGIHLIPDMAGPYATDPEASVLLGQSGIVDSIEFDRAGKTLASIGWVGVVQLWDPARAGEVGDRLVNEDQFFCLAYAPDGKTIAIGGRKEIAFYDLSNYDEPKDRWPSDMVRSIRYSADGKSLLTANNEGTVQLWDTARRSVSTTFDTHWSGLAQLSFAPDGIYWASIGVDLQARIWKGTAEGPPVPYLLPGGDYFALAFSPDGRRLFAGSRGGYIREWDVAGERPLRRHDTGVWVTALAVSPDGRLLARGDHDGNVAIFEPATRKVLLSRSAHPFGVSAVSFSPDGRLLASGGSDATIKLWNIADISATPPRISLVRNP